MFKKLGFIKISECQKRITAIRNEYEEKLSYLREYIEEIENKNQKIKSNYQKLSNKNRELQIELINKDKEIRYLKKALSNRSYIGLSSRVAWSMGEWE